MRCGTIINRATLTHSPPSGNMYGAAVAESQLVQASLIEDPSARWDVLDAGAAGPFYSAGNMLERFSDVSSLSAMFPGRVLKTPFTKVKELSQQSPYTLLASIPSFGRLAEMRFALNCATIPICSVAHSVLTRNMTATYTWLLLNALPHDVIVASSSAVHHALDSIFEQLATAITKSLAPAKRLQQPRIVDIPFGVDIPDVSTLDQPTARRWLGLPASSYTLLYLGRLSETYKADLDLLLLAVRVLTTRYPFVRLLLAGQSTDAGYLTHLQIRVTQLALHDKVLILNDFPPYSKPHILSACDVLVSPLDSIQESFGLSILEGMAHAKPVIASSWSGYKDLVQHGTTGFLLTSSTIKERLDDASRGQSMAMPWETSLRISRGTLFDLDELVRVVEHLINNPDLSVRMGSLGRARARDHFSWREVVRRFSALWNEQQTLLAQAPQPAAGFIPIDLCKVFAHYPDQLLAISDDLRLVRSTCLDKISAPYSGDALPASARALLSEIDASPEKQLSLQQVISNGYQVADVLWLSKKGLCRLSPCKADDTLKVTE